MKILILLINLLILPNILLEQAQANTMQGLQTSFAPIVQKVAPAVANISTQKVVQRQMSPFANDPFFQMFFGNTVPGITQDKVERSLGSGVIVRPDGLFITNYHVVQGADKVTVSLADKREFEAVMIDGDQQLDLAIMQLDTRGEKLPYASFGDSDKLQVGDIVLAIGNPFGVGQSVSMGIVSALGRSNVTGSDMGDFIQTDAAINPGNSGGALVNAQGEIIGINSAIFTRSGGSNGIGFAIPANAVRTITESVISTGEVQRGWFGASGQNITQLLANKLDLKTPEGVLINEIANNSPAANAGLKVGDILLAFNNVDIANVKALKSRVATTPLGEMVPIKVSRTGKTISLKVKLVSPPKRSNKDRLTLEGQHPLNGYVVEQLSPALAQELGRPFNAQGVVVIKAARSAVRMQPGDIIEQINKHKINTIQDVKAALKDIRNNGWNFVYSRGNRVYRMVIR